MTTPTIIAAGLAGLAMIAAQVGAVLMADRAAREARNALKPDRWELVPDPENYRIEARPDTPQGVAIWGKACRVWRRQP